MAQTGYTAIQLYVSPTTGNAPTAGNLASGELAINSADGKLFYKNPSANVRTIGQDSSDTYLTSVAGTDTITAVTLPALPAYKAGQTFQFVAAASNTGPVTININGLGAKAITKSGATALIASDILAGAAATLIYDGTRFQLSSAAAGAAKAGPLASSGITGAAASGANSDITSVGVTTTINGTVIGYREVPQNSQSAAYTLALTDAGKHILHPSADTTARTFTVPANASVAFPIGTAISVVNQNAAGVITISITTDTMCLAGAGTTGNRTLAANGICTLLKVASTEWIVSGSGLT